MHRLMLLFVMASMFVAAAPSGSDIDFHVRVDPARKGVVFCALYDDATSWLGERKFSGASVVADAPWVVCRFPNVPAGHYAIAAFHDQNGNRVLDKNWLGIPSEPYAASRDAHLRGRLGAPRWADAAFTHDDRKRTVTYAHMKQ